MELAGRITAGTMKGKTSEELREQFGLPDDLSPEQKEELQRRTMAISLLTPDQL